MAESEVTVKQEPDLEDMSGPLNEEPRSLESNRMPEQAVTGTNNRYSNRKIDSTTVLIFIFLMYLIPFLFDQKKVNQRIKIPFTTKSLLAEFSYPYFDWVRCSE